MRELKILVIVGVVVGVLYWGVEPLAHSVFHPKTAPVDFAFNDLQSIDLSKGDKDRGEAIVTGNCIACHNIKAAGFDNGVLQFDGGKDGKITTPDLSTAGAIYDEKFLAALIIDPVHALKLEHKFNDENPFPMLPYAPEGDDIEQEVADIVAYLKSIGSVSLRNEVIYSQEYTEQKEALAKSELSDSKKEAVLKDLEERLTNKAVFQDACSRCHNVRYDEPKSAEHLAQVLAKRNEIKNYLGAEAPDLSMIIRAKGEHYLEAFINNPQRVAYSAIKQAVLDSLVNQKRAEEIEKINTDSSLNAEQKAQKIAVEEEKDAKAYGISLPENTSKSPWQEDDDYTNLAKEMGVMPVGLSMPRVGLTQESQDRVIAYLESVGDSKKQEREALGVYLIIFFGVLSVLAYFWKRKIWKQLH